MSTRTIPPAVTLPTDRPIRVGIIGLSASGGWAASAHVPALRALDGYELRALAASSSERAKHAAQVHGVPLALGTPEELAANEASYTGGYLKDVLVDERVHGHIAANAARMEAIEAANLASLGELVKSDRLKVEA